MSLRREVIVDSLLIVVSVSAMALAFAAFRNGAQNSPSLPQRTDREVANWRSLAAEGHRTGPPDAALTIIEWGDYECPACLVFERNVRALAAENPNDMAIVFRHWPLTTHRQAYSAARAAECAGEQDRFHAYHDLLFGNPDWSGEAFKQFAKQAGVADLPRFRMCISAREPVPVIERDIAAVQALGGWGTPTLIINGVHMGRVPDARELRRMLEAALDSRRAR